MSDAKVSLTHPFLRWIGGKKRTACHLSRYVPDIQQVETYWEPFAGAASLFLRLQPQKTILSDTNTPLMNFYKDVKARPDLVWRYLRPWVGPMDRARYLELRCKFNILPAGPHRSALLIALNRTCFNGVWRVNKQGGFNVPFGKIREPIFPSLRDLKLLSLALRRTELLVGDFQQVLRDVEAEDFVYLDPPYPPINGTAFFTHYTRERFSVSDQERLADVVKEIDARGCRFMLSTADVEWVRGLYSGFCISRLEGTRFVAAGGVRHKVRDLVITNYDP